jgi:hypothetical protein
VAGGTMPGVSIFLCWAYSSKPLQRQGFLLLQSPQNPINQTAIPGTIERSKY